jgi:hypothetical protein
VYTKKAVPAFCVTVGELSWKDVKKAFEDKWTCEEEHRLDIVYKLGEHSKSEIAYTCYCECQQRMYKNNNHDPNLMYLRIFKPTEVDPTMDYTTTVSNFNWS